MEALLSTADLCDRFLDNPAAIQVVAPGLRPFGGHPAYAGQIATLAPATADSAVRLRDLLAEPGRGRVLVVDGHACDHWAVLGDQLAGLGQRNGWAGVVLNGYVRDTRTLAGLPIGVHALGTMPSRPRQFAPGERDRPLEFLRTRFIAGHWLYADEDGIVLCAEPQHDFRTNKETAS